jgi:Uma2 family endonuclease
MEISNLSQLDLDKSYTFADYYFWKFQERVELLWGKIMKMSPATSRIHQEIAQYINFKLSLFLEKKACKVYFAPFDVRLDGGNGDQKIINVVQPDICVVCDLAKLDEKG